MSSQVFLSHHPLLGSSVRCSSTQIMDYLGLKDSSRQLRTNCAISYSFYLHLMLHACAARFDVTENLENFWFLGGI